MQSGRKAKSKMFSGAEGKEKNQQTQSEMQEKNMFKQNRKKKLLYFY